MVTSNTPASTDMALLRCGAAGCRA
jgi:hypothetical protein